MVYEGLGYGFNREEAARAAGVTEDHIRNWMDRYRLFDHMQRGKGYHLTFCMRDLFTLAIANALLGIGMSARDACDAARHELYYGTWLNSPDSTVSFTRNKDGRLIYVSLPGSVVEIIIHLDPLYAQIRSRLGIEAQQNSKLADELAIWDAELAKLRTRQGA